MQRPEPLASAASIPMLQRQQSNGQFEVHYDSVPPTPTPFHSSSSGAASTPALGPQPTTTARSVLYPIDVTHRLPHTPKSSQSASAIVSSSSTSASQSNSQSQSHTPLTPAFSFDRPMTIADLSHGGAPSSSSAVTPNVYMTPPQSAGGIRGGSVAGTPAFSAYYASSVESMTPIDRGYGGAYSNIPVSTGSARFNTPVSSRPGTSQGSLSFGGARATPVIPNRSVFTPSTPQQLPQYQQQHINGANSPSKQFPLASPKFSLNGYGIGEANEMMTSSHADLFAEAAAVAQQQQQQQQQQYQQQLQLQQQEQQQQSLYQLASPPSTTATMAAPATIPSSVRSSFEKTVLDKNRPSALLQSQHSPLSQQPSPQQTYEFRQEEKEQYVPIQQQQQQHTQQYQQTAATHSSSSNPTLASLSIHPSSTLRSKITQITSLITQFDAQFIDNSRGVTKQPIVYPAWALPFVSEMVEKLATVIEAKKIAEAREVREEEERVRQQQQAEEQERQRRQHEEKMNMTARIRAQEEREREEHRRQQQREQEESDREQQQRRSKHHHQSPPPTTGYFPSAIYKIDMNSQLPFTRDHRVGERKGAVDATIGRRTVTSSSSSRRPTSSSTATRSSPSRHTSIATQSKSELEHLLANDLNATLLNRIIKATKEQESKGNRFGKAQRFKDDEVPDRTGTIKSPVQSKAGSTKKKSSTTGAPSSSSAATSTTVIHHHHHGSPSPTHTNASPQPDDKQQTMELEVTALKLQIEDLVLTMKEKEEERERDKERRRRDEDHAFRAKAQSTPDSESDSEDDALSTQLATALLKIGEMNRTKFVGLTGKIQELQELIVKQQEDKQKQTSDVPLVLTVPSLTDDDSSRERELLLRAQLTTLQHELHLHTQEKDALTQKLKELANAKKRDEKRRNDAENELINYKASTSRMNEKDSALMKTYQSDLLSSARAIDSLQALLKKESDHATQYRQEKSEIEKKLEELRERWRKKQQMADDERRKAEEDAKSASSHSKLPVSEKFHSFMNKYLAYHYRKEYQALLLQQQSNLNSLERAESELLRTKEKYEMEMKYRDENQKNILSSISNTLQSHSTSQQTTQQELDLARQALQQAEEEKKRQEEELQMIEMMNAELKKKLGEKSSANTTVTHVSDSDFNSLLLSSFKGDYLQIRNDPSMLKAIYALGDEQVIFSDYLERIDSRNKKQKRILIITERHALCAWADRGRSIRRVIPITSIEYISLSRQNGQLFVLHPTMKDQQSSYDYCLLSSKRNEIFYHLMTQLKLLTNGTRTLKYNLTERLYILDRNKTHRDIMVKENHELILGQSTYRPPSVFDEKGELRGDR